MAKTQTHVLTKITLDPDDGASVVDFPANQHAQILLAKGGGAQITPAEAYRRLMDHAAQMVARLEKSASGKRPTQEQCFARLFESRDPVIRELVNIAKAHGVPLHTHPPADTDFDTAMAIAKVSHVTDPSRTVEQHFAEIFERRRLEKSRQTDDDEEMADPEGDFDEDPTPDLGPPREMPSTRQNPHRSSSIYERGSGANFKPEPNGAAVGSVEGSYDPKRRPASATRPASVPVREGDDPRYEKRLARARRLIDKGYTAEDAVKIATMPKAQRRAAKGRLGR